MPGPTNTPFGWSPFAVMHQEEARRASELLREQGIPVIARPADDDETELLVPTASEVRARDLLQAAPAPAGAAIEDQGDADDWDGHEEDATEGRMEDLGDVFDAADRLKHQPWNQGAAAELARAVEAITGTSAPFGIGEAFWEQARTMAIDLQTLIATGEPEDTVRQAAEALRDLLRPYI